MGTSLNPLPSFTNPEPESGRWPDLTLQAAAFNFSELLGLKGCFPLVLVHHKMFISPSYMFCNNTGVCQWILTFTSHAHICFRGKRGVKCKILNKLFCDVKQGSTPTPATTAPLPPRAPPPPSFAQNGDNTPLDQTSLQHLCFHGDCWKHLEIHAAFQT